MGNYKKSIFKIEQIGDKEVVKVRYLRKKIIFNINRIGPGHFYDLHNSCSDDESRPAFSQLVSLLYPTSQARWNRDSMKILKDFNYYIAGDTAMLFVHEKRMIYIKNHPEIKNGKIAMDENKLRKRYVEGDKDINLISYDGFKKGKQSIVEFSKNPLILNLTKGEEGAEKLAMFLAFRKKTTEPCINFPENLYYKQIRIPVIVSDMEDTGYVYLGANEFQDLLVSWNLITKILKS